MDWEDGSPDGWNYDDRVEFRVPNDSGLSYHFLIPRPLYEYITDLQMVAFEITNWAEDE